MGTLPVGAVDPPHFLCYAQAAVSMLALHHLDFLQGLVFFPWQASDGSEETTAEDAVSCFFEIDFHLPAMSPADD